MAELKIPEKQIDDDSAPLDELDHRRLSRADLSLERGLDVWNWWRKTIGEPWASEFDGEQFGKILEQGGGIHREAFPLLRPLQHRGGSEGDYGFFDQIPFEGREQPVMGLVLQTLFDKPKGRLVEGSQDRDQALDRWCEGVREFALRYLIRLTSFNVRTPYVDPEKRPVERYLRPLNWSPTEEEKLGGFGFSQIYYKRRGSGLVGKFREADQDGIDLRCVEDIDGEYEWIVVGIRIHDLHLRNPITQSLNLAIQDKVLAVLSRDLIVRDERREKGLRGRYGFGYTVLKDPAGDSPKSLVWQRPEIGFQLNQLLVKDDGEILGRVLMVTDRLPRLASINPWSWPLDLADLASVGLFSPALSRGLDLAEIVSPKIFAPAFAPLKRLAKRLPVGPGFDPFSGFIDFANTITFGQAARRLSISKGELLKSLLADFARSQLATLVDARGVWRSIPDWTRADDLPDWLKS